MSRSLSAFSWEDLRLAAGIQPGAIPTSAPAPHNPSYAYIIEQQRRIAQGLVPWMSDPTVRRVAAETLAANLGNVPSSISPYDRTGAQKIAAMEAVDDVLAAAASQGPKSRSGGTAGALLIAGAFYLLGGRRK